VILVARAYGYDKVMRQDPTLSLLEPAALKRQIRGWSEELGFTGLGVANTDLTLAGQRLGKWLGAGQHGDMSFMAAHGNKRTHPAQLLPGTVRIISVRMNYFPRTGLSAATALALPNTAYVARYALGRDYHRLMRRRLQQLADRIARMTGPFRYRAFVDSAPVMEKPLAQAAGLGWIGKHTNLVDRFCGSWFFLGELYTDLPLPADSPAENHCGTCTRCAAACPTGALDSAYQLDARRCISYLTIEHRGAIPVRFRIGLGNRIFGCDDCQLVCPWNRFAPTCCNSVFIPRHRLDSATLRELFLWTEENFLERTAGSPIRRIGYQRWLRNIAVALGNGSAVNASVTALVTRRAGVTAMVREHIDWALDRLGQSP